MQRALRRVDGYTSAPVPKLEVKGRMFPVEEIYLDAALPHSLEDLSRCQNPRRPQARQNAFGGDDPDESPEATQQILGETARGMGGMGGMERGVRVCRKIDASRSTRRG